MNLRQHGADTIDGIDDVGARLAEDDQQHGGFAVGIAGIAHVLNRIHGLTDVRDAHSHTVVISDQQRLVIDRLKKLIVGAHFPHLAAVREVTFGSVRIRRRNRRAYLLEPDAILIQTR